MNDQPATTPDPSLATGSNESPPSPVAWPPPGLERMQGDLWGAVDRLGVGGFILVAEPRSGRKHRPL